MATYIIGDIHGCFETLQGLLNRIQWSRTDDRIFLTGDLVNGGPGSAEVMRWARENAAGMVLGNHDLHLLAVDAGARPLRRADTFQDVLAAHDRRELLHWLSQQPLVVLQGEFVLVHAGLLPEWSPEEARALAAEVEVRIRSDQDKEFFRLMYGDEPRRWQPDLTGADRLRVIVNAMTRLRMLTPEGEIDMDFKAPLREAPETLRPWFSCLRRHDIDERRVFFGHWAALGLYMDDRVVGLDSGCAWGGHLTAFRLDDGQIFQVRSELSGARSPAKP